MQMIWQDADGNGDERAVLLNFPVDGAEVFDVINESRASSIGKGHGEKEAASGGLAASISRHAGIVRSPAWARYALPTLLGLLLCLWTPSAKAKNWGEKAADDAQKSLIVGKSTSKEAEGFFYTQHLIAGFVTRADEARVSPKFPWSSDKAVGYYRSSTPNLGRSWSCWLLCTESVEIDVEIDSDNLVSKVLIRRWYTSL
jgi:hypothetical protein